MHKMENFYFHCRCAKHCYFMDRSDFIESFLELKSEELKRPLQEMSTLSLQSHFESCLASSSLGNVLDESKVQLSIASLSLTEQLLRIINATETVSSLNSPSNASRGKRCMK